MTLNSLLGWQCDTTLVIAKIFMDIHIEFITELPLDYFKTNCHGILLNENEMDDH